MTPDQDADPPTHPVQVRWLPSHERRQVPTVVSLRAYEVYAAVHGPQPALITGWCRGGFSAGELIAYLYAYPYPKQEWRARVEEAFRGMRGL